MKSYLITSLLFVWAVTLSAQYNPPAGYYSSANGLTGTALQNALHNIIKDHTIVRWQNNYNPNVWMALEVLDQDPQNSNNIISLYTNRSIPKAAKDGYGTGAAYEWNREHIFPKSKGFDNRSWPPYNDLFSLAASQDNVNNARGNKPYDNGGNQNYKAEGTNLWNRADSDSWETWDGRKGDVARAIFYMVVRYNGSKTNEPNLQISDFVGEATTGSLKMAKLSTLLQWHAQDPVDDRERKRNHIIYTNYQGNRNPFIDNPNYVAAIWGGGSNPPVGGGNTLTSGQAVTGSVTQGNWVHYTIQLPSNATGLSIAMTGTGDADLYTRYNAQPTSTQWDYRPYLGGSTENVTYASVVAGGTYHISVYGYATSTYSLTANVTTGSSGGGGTPPSGGNTLTSGQAVSGSVTQGAWKHYTIQLPSNATGLSVSMTGTGDADLYTRYNAQPTSSQWDFRPYIGGSNESVTYASVVPGGTYHISVNGYAASSTYSLTATVTTGSSGGGSTPPSGNGVIATYNFDNGTQGWTNPDGTYGWRRTSGNTPSGSTGPSNDQSVGSSSGSYFFMESTSGQGPFVSTNPPSYLVSPNIGGSNRSVEFYFHMYGSTMGTLHLDVSTNGGSTWTSVWSRNGQQHTSSTAPWTQATVNLGSYSGTIQLRFRGVSTASSNGWRSDMAVDSVRILGSN
ncbi:MAG: endonuclease [Puniceicoccaceae bacterium]